MKTTLAGTSTDWFMDVIQGAFSGIDPASVQKELDIPDEPEEEEEELLAQMEDPPTTKTSTPSTSTLSKAVKHKVGESSNSPIPQRLPEAPPKVFATYLRQPLSTLLHLTRRDTCTQEWRRDLFQNVNLPLVENLQAMGVSLPMR